MAFLSALSDGGKHYEFQLQQHWQCEQVDPAKLGCLVNEVIHVGIDKIFELIISPVLCDFARSLDTLAPTHKKCVVGVTIQPFQHVRLQRHI
jgi:hypothetical protein